MHIKLKRKISISKSCLYHINDYDNFLSFIAKALNVLKTAIHNYIRYIAKLHNIEF